MNKPVINGLRLKLEACTSSSQLAEQSATGWLIAALESVFVGVLESAFFI